MRRLLLIAALLLAPAPLLAEGFRAHDYLAVADAELSGKFDPALAALIADALVEGAQQVGNLKVVDRGRQTAVVAELEVQCSDMTAPECRVEMGQQLGAGFLLTSSLRKLGKTCALTVSWLNLETGVAKATRTRAGDCDLIGLLELARGLAVETLSNKTGSKGTSTLSISLSEGEGSVLIDGISRGIASPDRPLRVAGLKPGEHRVEVPETSAYLRAEMAAKSAAGVESKIVVQRVAKAASLTVRCEPEAGQVSINGRAVGATPGPFSVEPGRVRLEVEAPGYRPYSAEITVKAGERAESSVLLAPQGESSVRIVTNLGSIDVRLFPDRAPKSVANFLRYVREGHYDGTVFHRVIDKFMVQGGGYDQKLRKKPTHEPIKNEATNGLKNRRGTLAMARTGMVDSATAQFFINAADNAFLDHKGTSPAKFGYAVFGEVTAGILVVDAISKRPTGACGPFQKDCPQPLVVIERIELR